VNNYVDYFYHPGVKYICNKWKKCKTKCRHKKEHTKKKDLGCMEGNCDAIKKALAKCIEVKNKTSGGR